MVTDQLEDAYDVVKRIRQFAHPVGDLHACKASLVG
jgi:hypothetical protein